MVSKLNTKAPSPTLSAVPPASSASANGYAPSVPIPVYRQLAAELETTKALLESVNRQNQELTQQNQRLRQEVGRLVQSALTLQQLVGGNAQSVSVPSVSSVPAPPTVPAAPSSFSAPAAPSVMPATPDLPNFEELFAEQAQESRPSTPSPRRDMGGLWLTLVIVAVMLSAFGAGFLVVRPLLQNNSR